MKIYKIYKITPNKIILFYILFLFNNKITFSETSKIKIKKKSKKSYNENNKSNSSLNQDINLKKMRDSMTLSQFKKLIEFWNEFHGKEAVATRYNKAKEDITSLEDLNNKISKELKIIKNKIDETEQKKEIITNEEPKNRKDRKIKNKNILKLEMKKNDLLKVYQEREKALLAIRNKISFTKNNLKNISHQIGLKKNIAMAELLILNLDHRDLTSFSNNEKEEINLLRVKLKGILSEYNSKNKLEKEKYEDLLKYNKNLKNIIKGSPTKIMKHINLKENMYLIKNLLSMLENEYINYSMLNKLKLYKTINALKKDLRSWENANNIKISTIHEGVVFKVQIGAYKNLDLSKLKKPTEKRDILNQKNINNLHQYTLGTFRNYWKADLFKKHIRNMGIKDAYIIAIKDGKQISIKEAISYFDRTKSLNKN